MGLRRPDPRPGLVAQQFLGWFGLGADGTAAGAKLGYRLRAAVWGRGYATEGSRALVRAAFTELGADRVRAETMADWDEAAWEQAYQRSWT